MTTDLWNETAFNAKANELEEKMRYALSPAVFARQHTLNYAGMVTNALHRQGMTVLHACNECYPLLDALVPLAGDDVLGAADGKGFPALNDADFAPRLIGHAVRLRVASAGVALTESEADVHRSVWTGAELFLRARVRAALVIPS